MKNVLIILAFIFSGSAIGQTAPSNSMFQLSNGIKEILRIDPIRVNVTLDCKIEIDGHIFDNKKSKDPIKFEADFDGIKISNSKQEYTHRKCSEKGCVIVHLERKYSNTTFMSMPMGGRMTTTEYKGDYFLTN